MLQNIVFVVQLPLTTIILVSFIISSNLIIFGLLILLWILAKRKGWNWLYHIAKFMLASMLIGIATALSNAIQNAFDNALGVVVSCLITGMAAGVLAVIAEGMQVILERLRPPRLVGLGIFAMCSGTVIILGIYVFSITH